MHAATQPPRRPMLRRCDRRSCAWCATTQNMRPSGSPTARTSDCTLEKRHAWLHTEPDPTGRLEKLRW